MIDEKKIEEAARYYCNNRYPASQDAPFIAEGFRHGAKWAIQEFLKDLWYPASEEPVKDKPFLAKQIGRWRVDVNSSLFPNNVWSTHCKKQGIKRWLYIEDLLPKTQKVCNHD